MALVPPTLALKLRRSVAGLHDQDLDTLKTEIYKREDQAILSLEKHERRQSSFSLQNLEADLLSLHSLLSLIPIPSVSVSALSVVTEVLRVLTNQSRDHIASRKLTLLAQKKTESHQQSLFKKTVWAKGADGLFRIYIINVGFLGTWEAWTSVFGSSSTNKLAVFYDFYQLIPLEQ